MNPYNQNRTEYLLYYFEFHFSLLYMKSTKYTLILCSNNKHILTLFLYLIVISFEKKTL